MTDALARLTAALADRYAIERELGQGGMAIGFRGTGAPGHRGTGEFLYYVMPPCAP